MSSPRDKLPRGARIHIQNDGVVPVVLRRTNTRLSMRLIIPPSAHLYIESDGNAWFPLNTPDVLHTSTTTAIGDIAAGTASAVVTATVSGAREGMHVRLAPTINSAAHMGAQMIALVTANDTVSLRAVNVTGSLLTLPSTTYRPALEYFD